MVYRSQRARGVRPRLPSRQHETGMATTSLDVDIISFDQIASRSTSIGTRAATRNPRARAGDAGA